MKVLVIGGTGNISRGIVAVLQNRNHEVVMFNRGQHRDPPPPDVRVIQGDRKDREDFEAKVSAEEWDAVIDMISFNADDAALRTPRMPRTRRTLRPLFNCHDLRTPVRRHQSSRNGTTSRYIRLRTR